MSNLYPKEHKKITRKKIVLGIIISFIIFRIILTNTPLPSKFLDYLVNFDNDKNINSFEECIAAGYPAMESYPRQCQTSNDRTFVEDILIGGDVDNYGCLVGVRYSWNETDYACVREWIKEGDERYQDRVYCQPEQRNSDTCIFLHNPVCGWSAPEEIQGVTYPCASTYSNNCIACSDENVLYYEKGECPKK